MGEKLPPQEMKLYHRVDEVLHYVWDPIGVSRAPAARDEYYSYLPVVFGMLKKGAAPDDIRTFLTEIESEHMGLGERPGRHKCLDEVVQILLEYKRTLLED